MKKLLPLSLALAIGLLSANSSYNYKITYDNSGNTISRVQKSEVQPMDSVQIKPDGDLLKVEISPNPTTGLMTVYTNISPDEYPIQIIIHSAAGKVMYQASINAAEFVIDISDFPTGVYILTAIVGERKSLVKFLKK